MTNDKQVEVWRIEFEATVDNPEYLKRFPSGNYSWDATDFMWAGFQRAKRNQPVIELPYPDHGDGFRYWAENEIDAAITAAGYSYRVRS